jgi:hypothetical protein
MSNKNTSEPELQTEPQPEGLLKKIDALLYILTLRMLRENEEDDAAK